MVHVRRRLLAAALLLGGGVSSSGAQGVPRPFLDLQPGTATTTTGTSSTLGVAPGLSWQGARGAAWLRGSGEFGGGATRLAELDAQGRSTLLRLGRVDLGAGARMQFDRTREGESFGRLSADLRVGTRGAARGVSAGLGLRAASAPGWRFAAASARVGGWFRALGVSLSAEISAGQLPVVPTDSGGRPLAPAESSPPPIVSDTEPAVVNPPVPFSSVHRVSTFASEARLAMSTRLAGMDLDGTAGMYFFDRATQRGYGTITLTRWVTPRIAALVGGSVRALDPGAGRSRSVALFGVRVATGRIRRHLVDAPPAASTALAIARHGDRVTLEFSAPGARLVEIAGDFTHWNTVPLERSTGDRWSLTLPLAPGVYRLNVRVDEGDWTPPPGASRVADPYEGTVGVIVVP